MVDMKKEIELEKADAQFTGWVHRDLGGNLLSLVESMGLTLGEWQKLKKQYSVTSYMHIDDLALIDNYFEKQL